MELVVVYRFAPTKLRRKLARAMRTVPDICCDIHTTSEAMSPPNRVTHTHHSTATHRKSRSNTPNHWPPLRTHKHIYIYLHITIIIFIERASFIFYRSIYNNGNLGLVVWWSE